MLLILGINASLKTLIWICIFGIHIPIFCCLLSGLVCISSKLVEFLDSGTNESRFVSFKWWESILNISFFLRMIYDTNWMQINRIWMANTTVRTQNPHSSWSKSSSTSCQVSSVVLHWGEDPSLGSEHTIQGKAAAAEVSFWIGSQNNQDIDYSACASSPQFFSSSDSDPWLQWWAVQQWGCCGIHFQHLFHLPCYCSKQNALAMMILNDHMIC